MKEILIKIDVPFELEEKFEIALDKVVKDFTRHIRFALLKDIMKDSKLTDEQSDKIAEEFNENFSKKHPVK